MPLGSCAQPAGGCSFSLARVLSAEGVAATKLARARTAMVAKRIVDWAGCSVRNVSRRPKDISTSERDSTARIVRIHLSPCVHIGSSCWPSVGRPSFTIRSQRIVFFPPQLRSDWRECLQGVQRSAEPPALMNLPRFCVVPSEAGGRPSESHHGLLARGQASTAPGYPIAAVSLRKHRTVDARSVTGMNPRCSRTHVSQYFSLTVVMHYPIRMNAARECGKGG